MGRTSARVARSVCERGGWGRVVRWVLWGSLGRGAGVLRKPLFWIPFPRDGTTGVLRGGDGGGYGGYVVGGDDGVLVDHGAEFDGEGVKAAVWLFDCSDAGGGGVGVVGWHGGGSGCLVSHFGIVGYSRSAGSFLMVLPRARGIERLWCIWEREEGRRSE